MLFIFDLDDTIYDYMWPFNQTVKKILGVEDEAACFELYKTMRKCSDETFEMQQRGEITVQDAGYLRVAQMAEIHDLNFDQERCRDFHHTYLEFQQKIEIKPEIKEIFEMLKEHNLPTAIITNGNGTHQQRKIEQLQVTDYINPRRIFVTGDYGFDKPDHRIFDIAINALRGDFAKTFYIGDSYSSDVVGSKNAGIKSIWLKIRDFEIDYLPDCVADYTVASHGQLKELINEIVGG